MAERRIVVEFAGDTSSLERAFARSARGAKNFNRGVERQFSGTIRSTRNLTGMLTGLGAGLIGAAGAVSIFRGAFQEMADLQKVAAQTLAVLDSTGRVAGVTATEIDKLAGSLSQLSGVDDEVIQAGENLLLTFPEIRNEMGRGNDIFNQATLAALDLSTAMGTDLKAASIQVGKALNDPARGYARLQRIGVAFTKAQVKQIKAMSEAGNVAGAQKIILAELNREFGGSAKAMGETLPGKVNILKETLSNMGGTIAEELLPEITKVVDQFNAWLQNPQNQKNAIDDITGALKAMGAVAKTTADVIKGIKGTIDTIGGAFDWAKLDFLNQGLIQSARNLKFPGLKQTAEKAGEESGTAYTLGFNTAVKEHLDQVNQTLDKKLGRTRIRGRDTTPDNVTGPKGVSQTQRNTWFHSSISRQLNRLQDLGLRQQLKRLRAIAAEVRAQLALTHDKTRQLTLNDKLLDIYRQQKAVQEEIGASIQAANAALKERADAIKSALLERLQARQQNIENKRELRDARERLRIARQLGTAQGIRTARENLQTVTAQGMLTRLEAAPATLTKGGQFALGNIVTIHINGVTDPAEVARRVDEILRRRRRRTGAGGQSRPTAAGQTA